MKEIKRVPVFLKHSVVVLPLSIAVSKIFFMLRIIRESITTEGAQLRDSVQLSVQLDRQ